MSLLMKSKVALTRFKGLGEMNPDQLWETTMDPTKRTLFEVTIEDAQATDGLFVKLMGTEVAPRREYIEKHALEARELDV
jgi:DNA gyrase subunit B